MKKYFPPVCIKMKNFRDEYARRIRAARRHKGQLEASSLFANGNSLALLNFVVDSTTNYMVFGRGDEQV